MKKLDVGDSLMCSVEDGHFVLVNGDKGERACNVQGLLEVNVPGFVYFQVKEKSLRSLTKRRNH